MSTPFPDRPDLPDRPRAPALRLDADPDDVGRGLGRLVLALLDIVRELLERQALRRVDAGDLTPEEVERLGRALIALQEKFDELRDVFGVEPEDLHLPVDLDELLDGGRTAPAHQRRTAPVHGGRTAPVHGRRTAPGETQDRTTRPGGRTP